MVERALGCVTDDDALCVRGRRGPRGPRRGRRLRSQHARTLGRDRHRRRQLPAVVRTRRRRRCAEWPAPTARRPRPCLRRGRGDGSDAHDACRRGALRRRHRRRRVARHWCTEGEASFDWVAVRAPELPAPENPSWGEPIELFNGSDTTALGAATRGREPVARAEDGVLVNDESGANLKTVRHLRRFQAPHRSQRARALQ